MTPSGFSARLDEQVIYTCVLRNLPQYWFVEGDAKNGGELKCDC